MEKSSAVYAIGLLLGLTQSIAASADCPILTTWPERPTVDTGNNVLQLEAGRADLDAYGESRLSGGVELNYQDKQIRTKALRYDQPSRRLDVEEALDYLDSSTQISADEALAELGSGQLSFASAQFRLRSGGRGSASDLRLSQAGSLQLADVRYTTCPDSSPAWALRGEEIHIDSARGQGTARNVWLRFFDVPLLYIPWFRFPVGDARQTGLLFPRVGTSDNTGTFIRWPYYINLHPQYDLTLTPEWLAERGNVLGGGARGLWSFGRAEANVRWLARDEQTDTRRWEADAQAQAHLSTNLRAELDYSEVSDIDFLRDLGLDQSDSATNVLERRLDLSYRPLPGMRIRARAQDFEILDPSVVGAVFSRAPELSLGYRPLSTWQGLRPRVQAEYVRFDDRSGTTAQRADALAALDWQQDARGWDASVSASLRKTEYRLQGDRRLQRTLPSYRAGVGLKLRRPLGPQLVQTLRPRLDYVYTPFREQSAIPIFDTSLPDFSLDQLRSSNRFSGIDRISDENTLIPSVESAVLDPLSGVRRARLRLGLQLRLADSDVALPGSTGSQDGSSDWLVELDVDAANGIRGRAAGQYNTQNNEFDAFSLGARFKGQRDRHLQLAYRFRRGLFEQIDALTLWPIAGGWSAAARWTWAVDTRGSIETLAGVSYQSCCWGLTAGVRRYLNGAAGDLDTGVFVQLAFTGLGNFGQGFGEFFDSESLSY